LGNHSFIAFDFAFGIVRTEEAHHLFLFVIPADSDLAHWAIQFFKHGVRGVFSRSITE